MRDIQDTFSYIETYLFLKVEKQGETQTIKAKLGFNFKQYAL